MFSDFFFFFFLFLLHVTHVQPRSFLKQLPSSPQPPPPPSSTCLLLPQSLSCFSSCRGLLPEHTSTRDKTRQRERYRVTPRTTERATAEPQTETGTTTHSITADSGKKEALGCYEAQSDQHHRSKLTRGRLVCLPRSPFIYPELPHPCHCPGKTMCYKYPHCRPFSPLPSASSSSPLSSLISISRT
ncbi:hypothetical protein B0T20DRAFT_155008 [Sordaria brevicollis]|uniref:Secreted protein n=1 Tax=Sordaria brevicollis TaxID=83679 RepID=A0AAE0PIZ6_SORBR|nr:hypothetical protein B0T20DRAFT_155008 [Sordaria brevicollis]